MAVAQRPEPVSKNIDSIEARRIELAFLLDVREILENAREQIAAGWLQRDFFRSNGSGAA